MTIFVMHIRRQHCNGCGRSETYSSLYQAEDASRGTKLLPCASISPFDPVRRVELGITQIPVCEGCLDESRATIGDSVYSSWQETLKRKANETNVTRFPSPVKATNQSLDDIA